MKVIFCEKCGQELHFESVKPKFCHSCGHELGKGLERSSTAKVVERERESEAIDMSQVKINIQVDNSPKRKVLKDLLFDGTSDGSTRRAPIIGRSKSEINDSAKTSLAEIRAKRPIVNES